MYEKPKVKVIEVSADDIIQTSNENLTVENGNLDITAPGNGFEFLSLRPSSVASDSLFRN